MPDAEQDKKPADIVKLPKGVYRINGEAHLDDVSRVLGVTLELDEFETFSGYILGTIGYIPEDGTQFEVTIGPLHIQIKKVQNHRIRQTLVRLEAPKQTGTEEKKPEEKNGK
jgi:putative hemolysin